MPLRDMYEPDELPTRPDHPNTVARRCRHCGRVYGDHVISKPPTNSSLSRGACRGMRRNYEPEDHADGDAQR